MRFYDSGVCPVKFKERLESGAFSPFYQDGLGDDEGNIGM